MKHCHKTAVFRRFLYIKQLIKGCNKKWLESLSYVTFVVLLTFFVM